MAAAHIRLRRGVLCGGDLVWSMGATGTEFR